LNNRLIFKGKALRL